MGESKIMGEGIERAWESMGDREHGREIAWERAWERARTWEREHGRESMGERA